TLPKQVEAYVSPASKMSFEGSGSYVTDSGGKVKWRGSYNYEFATKAKVDKWYGRGLRTNRSGLTRQTPPPDFGVPPKTFGGKVVLRPQSGNGQMCLRLSKQVSVRADGDELSKFYFPVPFLMAGAKQTWAQTAGSPPLGCFGLTFQDAPSNPSIANGRAFYENPAAEGSFLSMQIEWGHLQATGQPLPRSESK
ncbi:MAG: hypothetical protein ABEL97_12805, partial [Salinibacter sp.]